MLASNKGLKRTGISVTLIDSLTHAAVVAAATAFGLLRSNMARILQSILIQIFALANKLVWSNVR